MNLESLKIFRNVVEAGGFSKAVDRSGLTQSAISKQIQALEAEVGQQLLLRTTQSMQLTEAGQLLYRRSERILNEIDETEQLLRGYAGDLPAKLSIGTTQSIGISYFPGIFKNFAKNNPRCAMDVRIDVSPNLIRAVDQRQLDCAVVCLPPRLPQTIVVAKTFFDPLTLVASNELVQQKDFSNLLNKSQIESVIQEEPLILISSETYTRKIIDNYLFERDISVQPKMELASFDLIVSFVSLGLGISIVPQRVFPVYARSRSVSCRKLANLNLKRRLGIVVHRSRQDQKLIQEFVRYFAF